MSSIGKVPNNEDDDLLDDSSIFDQRRPEPTETSTRIVGNRGRKLKTKTKHTKKSTLIKNELKQKSRMV